MFKSSSNKLRETSLLTLMHMIRYNNEILNYFYSSIDNADILINLLDYKDSKISQSAITILLLSLLNSSNINDFTNILINWNQLLPSILINVIDNQNTPVICGKCFLCIGLLCKNKIDVLIKFLHMKLLNHIEKLSNKSIYPSVLIINYRFI